METRRKNGILFAAMPARLDAVTSFEVEKALGALLECGEDILVSDFSATAYVSSAGLRVMLAVSKRQRGAGRRFVLYHLAPDVREVFRIAGLESAMDIADSEEDIWRG